MNRATTDGRRLTAAELATAVPVGVEEVERLVSHRMLRPGDDGLFATSDIQGVRAVMAMRSPGITLEQLLPAFEAGFFTLQPIELLFPSPAAATSLTWRDLAGEVGLDDSALGRLVVAAGFPAVRPEHPVREDDAALVREVVYAGSLMGGGETTLRLARIYGESARRAAEGGLGLFEEGDNIRRLSHRDAMRDPHTRHEMNARGAQLMRLTAQLLMDLYRRHLEHALLRVWASAAEVWLDELGIRPSDASSPGVAFVDLGGFTALTESSGDAAAAQLAEGMADLAQVAAARHAGRVVKLLGDGAMLHFDTPLDAVHGALELVDDIASAGLPQAHAGVHAGPLIQRDGDYFGRTVNLAARISAQARPGEVLVSEDVARSSGDGLSFTPAGTSELKGIGRVALFRAAPATTG